MPSSSLNHIFACSFSLSAVFQETVPRSVHILLSLQLTQKYVYLFLACDSPANASIKILFCLCACILAFSHFFILLYCGLLIIKNCRLFTLIIVRERSFVNKPMMQKMFLDKRFLPVYNKYILLCYEREI